MTTKIFIIVSANNSVSNNFKESYCFLNLMLNKEMSSKENTLQLPPQFSSISNGESQRLNIAASERKGNIPKKIKFY